MVRNFDGCVIAHRQVAGLGTQARVAVAVRPVDDQRDCNRLADLEVLDDQRLTPRLRGVDVENEIAGLTGDFVLQFNEKL